MSRQVLYKDADFPPNGDSVYQIKLKDTVYQGNDVPKVVEWRRLKDLTIFRRPADGKSSVRLFEDGVQATDINQGSVGDCWLLSSLACLATRPGAMEKLFLTREYNEEGRYQLRLWDKQSRTYREITVDDFIPVWKQDGQPCFAQPSGQEAWVLLLEKAMAKYVGNYSFLDGGMPSWALQTLTGHYTCVFLLEQKFGSNRGAGPDPSSWRWLRAELTSRMRERVVAFGGRASPITRAAMYVYDEKDASRFYSHEEMFMAVSYHLAIGNLVAAASVGTDDDGVVDGVVRGHAYTVMAALPVNSNEGGQLMLVQLRNPHGAGGIEWTGDWSDNSELWRKHPEVAATVGYKAPASSSARDGTSWMEWKDFLNHFKEITFCCVNGFDYIEETTGATGWVEVFEDASFPHDHRSLGDYRFILNGQPREGAALDELIQWLRLKEIAAPDQFRQGVSGLRLFAGGGPAPEDIDGGSTGLMAAVACLANKPGAIEEMFVRGREYRSDGAYQIRLFEPKTRLVSIAPIDDWIPCYNATPITKTRIIGFEVWVLLLEKAVARMVGSYSKVSMWGVQVCWAFACLTGQYTCLFMWEERKKKWQRLELQYVEKTPGQYRAEYYNDETTTPSEGDMFKILVTQLQLGALVAAETDKQDVDTETTGLAKGRNYSLLEARIVTNGPGGSKTALRMVKLRDPSRKYEWKGDWSDSSELWEHYPKVAQALDFRREGADETDGERSSSGITGHSTRRDGTFWMSFQDFQEYFRLLTFCGDSLRGNNKPWFASQEDLDAAARRLAEARRLQALRAEQEALEDAHHQDLRRRALERATWPDTGTMFAQAAIVTSAMAPRRRPPTPPPAPRAATPAGAEGQRLAATAGGAVFAASPPLIRGSGHQQQDSTGASLLKQQVAVVDGDGTGGACKSCTIM